MRAYWALDVKRAQARFYPAVHPLQSYAEDARGFAPWWAGQGHGDWLKLRRRFLTLLDEQAHLERMARIIGKDALPVRQQLTLFCAELGQRGLPAPVGVLRDRPRLQPAAAGRDDAADRQVHRGGRGRRGRRACTPRRLSRLATLRPLQRMGEEIAGRRAGAL